MSVRIRMKKYGRKHQPFFRICAVDKHAPRDGRVIEELGTYDPLVPDTDARAILKAERIDYWLSVGAQPSERVSVLIKKYGTHGTHAEAQKTALEKLAQPRVVPDPGPPATSTKPAKPKAEPAAAAAEAETAQSPEASANGDQEADQPAEESAEEKATETEEVSSEA